jgi:diketogulonate reductase-like aldo/keto reductase
MLNIKIKELAEDSFFVNNKTGLQKSYEDRNKLINQINNLINNFPNALKKMPQLCFGTAQRNINLTVPKALELGYKHIDGAELYQCISKENHTTYKNIIKEEIKKYGRNELWITWKDDNIKLEKIKKIINELDCNYIDLFLVHNSCGTENDFIELKKAKNEGLIRFYGISNCEDLKIVKELKEKHDIYANQIQARPPKGKVYGRELFSPENFIEECNNLGVIIMLYGSMSAISDIRWHLNDEIIKKRIELKIPNDKMLEINDEFEIINSLIKEKSKNTKYDIMTEDNNIYKKFLKFMNDINITPYNKYYMQKYILNTNNVLMIGSHSGNPTNLQKNLDDYNNLKNTSTQLSSTEMNEIESNLEFVILSPSYFSIDIMNKCYADKEKW